MRAMRSSVRWTRSRTAGAATVPWFTWKTIAAGSPDAAGKRSRRRSRARWESDWGRAKLLWKVEPALLAATTHTASTATHACGVARRCRTHQAARERMEGFYTASVDSGRMPRRRVTFSRNLTLSLSRTCQCYCKYCAFATHQAHLHAPDEVLGLLDRAARRSVKELLVLTGERPEVNDEVRSRLQEWGHPNFVSYVIWVCERALERGLLPHTNLGVLQRDDLARLREVTASQGLMLESVNPDLEVHQGSPTKHPERRLATIAAAGALRIPFTSGILVGIGESEDERVAALEALAAVHGEHGHLQEVILQNFVPHRRYYGEEQADIATDAAERFWRTGVADAPHRDAPRWATPIGVGEMKRLIAEARLLLGVGIQVPPNLADWWPELVAAGATDLGGLSANGDHISPEHPFPSPHQVRKRLAQDGVALTERLCVYPGFIDPQWMAQGVLDVVKARYWSFIPRRGSGRTDAPRPIRRDLVAGATAKGRDGASLTPDELTAM